LIAESEVAEMLGKIPFVDKMTVAVANKQDIPRARKIVEKLFHL